MLAFHIQESLEAATYSSITLKHAVYQITQRTPKIFAARKVVFVDKQDIVLEACVQMRLQSELHNDRVMMTVDVRVHAIEPLEKLTYQNWKGFWKWNTWISRINAFLRHLVWLDPTYSAGKHWLIVYIALHPCHQMLNVFGCWHLCRSFEILGVLPEILKSTRYEYGSIPSHKILTHQ